jgi:hypothetical protein
MTDMLPPLEFQVPFWDAVQRFAAPGRAFSTAREKAVAEVNELIAGEFAKRDKRIIELSESLEYYRASAALLQQRIDDLEARPRRGALARRIVQARAEVPPWCITVLEALVEQRARGSIVAEEVLGGVYADQLRACGIEP